MNDNLLLNLPLTDFSRLLSTLNKEKDYELSLDFYSDLLSIYLSLPIDTIEDMDFDEHQLLSIEIVKKIVELNIYNQMLSEIRIDTETFYSNVTENDIKFKTKEFKSLQKKQMETQKHN